MRLVLCILILLRFCTKQGRNDPRNWCHIGEHRWRKAYEISSIREEVYTFTSPSGLTLELVCAMKTVTTVWRCSVPGCIAARMTKVSIPVTPSSLPKDIDETYLRWLDQQG